MTDTYTEADIKKFAMPDIEQILMNDCRLRLLMKSGLTLEEFLERHLIVNRESNGYGGYIVTMRLGCKRRVNDED